MCHQKIEMIYSLAFSLPGIPLLRYGDEIGMGDDLTLQERDSVRTPMQWTGEINGGFSTASPDALPHPVIQEGEYGFQHINVTAEQRDSASLLNWIEHCELDRHVRISSDIYQHIQWLEKDVELGFDELLLHNVNWEQEQFIEIFGEKVVPALR